MTLKEQEDRQIIKCLRHWLQWYNDTLSFDYGEEQYHMLLVDKDGCPHKSNKSKWTEKLQLRYQSAQPEVIAVYSRDHKGVGVAHKITSPLKQPQFSQTMIRQYWLSKTKPKQAFRSTQNAFNKLLWNFLLTT